MPFSPLRREIDSQDTSHLPNGGCRYILLHPEAKGLRCACVGFALNRSIPGSTCDCGHQACYHMETALVGRQELDALTEKVARLEDELDRERQGRKGELFERLGQLEELVDKNKVDNEAELKSVYRGMGGLWHNVGLLQKRTPFYDDRIEGLVDELQRMRNRLIEIDDDSMHLEERVDMLENASTPALNIRSLRRKASTPPSYQVDTNSPRTPKTEEPSSIASTPSLRPQDEGSPIKTQLYADKVASDGRESWTVHISLLPRLSQPFPFEKDTAAYKRCLSRGLHRVVAVPDTDSHSFQTAVSDAFIEILRGRQWQPLVARICDAKNLRGLPMLRQLPESLIGQRYDVDFLKENCAVTDDSGKIIDLYIAMCDHIISWRELRDLRVFLPGLETSWAYDTYLDGPPLDTENLTLDSNTYDSSSTTTTTTTTTTTSNKKPAGGDILWSSPSTRLKRNASEISRTPSFGSSTDGESSRTKIQRQCVGRRAEAV
ncbi:hypothetical protein B7494_g8054 [Chlorociboria aeruginascens]|nr:hypothetical protein B7494_g8054 [Chlorociboria aeruginascens]